MHKLIGFWRGANFISFKLLGRRFDVPFFWRYEAAYQKGRDAGWLATYREYEPKVARLKVIEQGIFELVEGDVITMSRAREILGEASIVPVRERYAAWLIGRPNP